MNQVWAELRGAVAALVLLGLVARLLVPLAHAAGSERAAFDAMVQASLCLPSGLPPAAGDDGTRLSTGGHCPLCRLPDALDHPVAPPLALPGMSWVAISIVVATAALLRPSPRGPPPARAPPAFPTLG